jgi:glutaminyl-tRNA synthetase
MADLNPGSEEVLSSAYVEPAAAGMPVGQAMQFERLGYFALDPDSTPGQPVFDRTVTLKDTWAKVQARGSGGA